MTLTRRARSSSRRSLGQFCVYWPYQTKRLHDTEKRAAAHAVSAALKSGTLTKQRCIRCGLKRAEAHHDDYAKPLDVTWLCRFHHRQRDAELREQRQKAARAATRAGVLFSPAAPDYVRPRLRQHDRKFIEHPQTEALVRRITASIADAMDANAVSENALACRLRSSRQFVNTLFSGGVRTVKTLAVVADVLGYDVHVELMHRQVSLEKPA